MAASDDALESLRAKLGCPTSEVAIRAVGTLTYRLLTSNGKEKDPAIQRALVHVAISSCQRVLSEAVARGDQDDQNAALASLKQLQEAAGIICETSGANVSRSFAAACRGSVDQGSNAAAGEYSSLSTGKSTEQVAPVGAGLLARTSVSLHRQILADVELHCAVKEASQDDRARQPLSALAADLSIAVADLSGPQLQRLVIAIAEEVRARSAADLLARPLDLASMFASFGAVAAALVSSGSSIQDEGDSTSLLPLLTADFLSSCSDGVVAKCCSQPAVRELEAKRAASKLLPETASFSASSTSVSSSKIHPLQLSSLFARTSAAYLLRSWLQSQQLELRLSSVSHVAASALIAGFSAGVKAFCSPGLLDLAASCELNASDLAVSLPFAPSLSPSRLRSFLSVWRYEAQRMLDCAAALLSMATAQRSIKPESEGLGEGQRGEEEEAAAIAAASSVAACLVQDSAAALPRELVVEIIVCAAQLILALAKLLPVANEDLKRKGISSSVGSRKGLDVSFSGATAGSTHSPALSPPSMNNKLEIERSKAALGFLLVEEREASPQGGGASGGGSLFSDQRSLLRARMAAEVVNVGVGAGAGAGVAGSAFVPSEVPAIRVPAILVDCIGGAALALSTLPSLPSPSYPCLAFRGVETPSVLVDCLNALGSPLPNFILSVGTKLPLLSFADLLPAELLNAAVKAAFTVDGDGSAQQQRGLFLHRSAKVRSLAYQVSAASAAASSVASLHRLGYWECAAFSGCSDADASVRRQCLVSVGDVVVRLSQGRFSSSHFSFVGLPSEADVVCIRRCLSALSAVFAGMAAVFASDGEDRDAAEGPFSSSWASERARACQVLWKRLGKLLVVAAVSKEETGLLQHLRACFHTSQAVRRAATSEMDKVALVSSPSPSDATLTDSDDADDAVAAVFDVIASSSSSPLQLLAPSFTVCAPFSSSARQRARQDEHNEEAEDASSPLSALDVAKAARLLQSSFSAAIGISRSAFADEDDEDGGPSSASAIFIAAAGQLARSIEGEAESLRDVASPAASLYPLVLDLLFAAEDAALATVGSAGANEGIFGALLTLLHALLFRFSDNRQKLCSDREALGLLWRVVRLRRPATTTGTMISAGPSLIALRSLAACAFECPSRNGHCKGFQLCAASGTGISVSIVAVASGEWNAHPLLRHPFLCNGNERKGGDDESLLIGPASRVVAVDHEKADKPEDEEQRFLSSPDLKEAAFHLAARWLGPSKEEGHSTLVPPTGVAVAAAVAAPPASVPLNPFDETVIAAAEGDAELVPEPTHQARQEERQKTVSPSLNSGATIISLLKASLAQRLSTVARSCAIPSLDPAITAACILLSAADRTGPHSCVPLVRALSFTCSSETQLSPGAEAELTALLLTGLIPRAKAVLLRLFASSEPSGADEDEVTATAILQLTASFLGHASCKKAAAALLHDQDLLAVIQGALLLPLPRDDSPSVLLAAFGALKSLVNAQQPTLCGLVQSSADGLSSAGSLSLVLDTAVQALAGPLNAVLGHISTALLAAEQATSAHSVVFAEATDALVGLAAAAMLAGSPVAANALLDLDLEWAMKALLSLASSPSGSKSGKEAAHENLYRLVAALATLQTAFSGPSAFARLADPLASAILRRFFAAAGTPSSSALPSSLFAALASLLRNGLSFLAFGNAAAIVKRACVDLEHLLASMPMPLSAAQPQLFAAMLHEFARPRLLVLREVAQQAPFSVAALTTLATLAEAVDLLPSAAESSGSAEAALPVVLLLEIGSALACCKAQASAKGRRDATSEHEVEQKKAALLQRLDQLAKGDVSTTTVATLAQLEFAAARHLSLPLATVARFTKQIAGDELTITRTDRTRALRALTTIISLATAGGDSDDDDSSETGQVLLRIVVRLTGGKRAAPNADAVSLVRSGEPEEAEEEHELSLCSGDHTASCNGNETALLDPCSSSQSVAGTLGPYAIAADAEHGLFSSSGTRSDLSSLLLSRASASGDLSQNQRHRRQSQLQLKPAVPSALPPQSSSRVGGSRGSIVTAISSISSTGSGRSGAMRQLNNSTALPPTMLPAGSIPLTPLAATGPAESTTATRLAKQEAETEPMPVRKRLTFGCGGAEEETKAATKAAEPAMATKEEPAVSLSSWLMQACEEAGTLTAATSTLPFSVPLSGVDASLHHHSCLLAEEKDAAAALIAAMAKGSLTTSASALEFASLAFALCSALVQAQRDFLSAEGIMSGASTGHSLFLLPQGPNIALSLALKSMRAYSCASVALVEALASSGAAASKRNVLPRSHQEQLGEAFWVSAVSSCESLVRFLAASITTQGSNDLFQARRLAEKALISVLDLLQAGATASRSCVPLPGPGRDALASTPLSRLLKLLSKGPAPSSHLKQQPLAFAEDDPRALEDSTASLLRKTLPLRLQAVLEAIAAASAGTEGAERGAAAAGTAAAAACPCPAAVILRQAIDYASVSVVKELDVCLREMDRYPLSGRWRGKVVTADGPSTLVDRCSSLLRLMKACADALPAAAPLPLPSSCFAILFDLPLAVLRGLAGAVSSAAVSSPAVNEELASAITAASSVAALALQLLATLTKWRALDVWFSSHSLVLEAVVAHLTGGPARLAEVREAAELCVQELAKRSSRGRAALLAAARGGVAPSSSGGVGSSGDECTKALQLLLDITL